MVMRQLDTRDITELPSKKGKKALLLVLFAMLLPASLHAGSTSEMRFMSYTITDRPISVTDAKALAAGTTTLEDLIAGWLASDAHKTRIKRFFNDQFGIGPTFDTVPPSFILQKQSDGSYYLTDKGVCGTDVVTISDAWWLDEGESVKVCVNTRSDLIYYQYDNKDDVECTDSGASGIGAAECGCGPRMILCYPVDLESTLTNHIRYEFRERGLYAYENDLSWLDLLGGNFFFGSRVLYKHYLDQQAFGRNIEPTLTDLVDLTNLPLDSFARRDFPTTGSVSRAGLVTSPGFLRQYNNFRSRISILTTRLLCKDVDSTLNTDGIATFVNETLAANDNFLFEEHGNKEGCSGCHYPMDNMGSVLWLWGAGGWYRYYGALGEQDERGHAFGVPGSGPRFLMEEFTKASGFMECMAKTVWEAFSGGVWDDLGSVSKAGFVSAANLGPRGLIQYTINSREIRQLHNMGIPQTVIGGASVYSFEADINPILQNSCSGGSCHSPATLIGSQYEFIGNENNFKSSPSSRIDDGSMPPAGSSLSISDADRAILKAWRDAN